MFNKFFLPFLLSAFLSTSSFASFEQIVLSTKTAEYQITQAESYYENGQIEKAHAIVKDLRPLLSEFTEMHATLYNSLKEEAKAKLTSESEKDQTIEFAKLRDRANYLAGMISIKQKNFREAAKHLVQVVESQRTTKLGEDAYEALRQIGFSPSLKLVDQI